MAFDGKKTLVTYIASRSDIDDLIPILVALLALSAFLWAGTNPTLALVGFFIFYSWHKIGSGSLAPAWEDMIAKIIPIDRRGRFFGVANFGGSLLGIAGAQVTTDAQPATPAPSAAHARARLELRQMIQAAENGWDDESHERLLYQARHEECIKRFKYLSPSDGR